MSKQVYYFDSSGKRYKGRIRKCDMCSREELVTIYNKKKRCKWCASKTRKDSIKESEISLPQKNGTYRIRAHAYLCIKCGALKVSRLKKKTELCTSCAASESCSARMTGKFGKLNYAYKNGKGCYRRIGREKNKGMCVICASDENVHIHHMDLNRDNNEPENLIPLCHFCHANLHNYLRKGLTHDEALEYVRAKRQSGSSTSD